MIGSRQCSSLSRPPAWTRARVRAMGTTTGFGKAAPEKYFATALDEEADRACTLGAQFNLKATRKVEPPYMGTDPRHVKLTPVFVSGVPKGSVPGTPLLDTEPVLDAHDGKFSDLTKKPIAPLRPRCTIQPLRSNHRTWEQIRDSSSPRLSLLASRPRDQALHQARLIPSRCVLFMAGNSLIGRRKILGPEPGPRWLSVINAL